MFVVPCAHFYPHTFFKKAKGILSPPSLRLLCYLFQTIGQNSTKFGVWVTLMNGARDGKFFLAPPPGALGRGQKVKYHLISITKSISKIFIPNFVCVLTNERYKTYQTGFLCPQRNFGRHIVIALSVRPSRFRVRSISSIFFEVGIPNLVCGYILRWRSVAYNFQVIVTLTSDLVFRIIVSGAYLLYYLR